MREESRTKTLDYLTFGFILILTELAVFLHLRYSMECDTVFGRDWKIHLINTFKIFHCNFSIKKILLWYKDNYIVHHPPFNYLISAVIWKFLKFPPLASVYASKAFWIFFSALAMYGVGKTLGDSRSAGIIAAIVGILNGLMLDLAREVSLESVVPMALAIIIYGYTLSFGYRRLLGSIILGITLGIGLVSKSVIFVSAVPFLVLGFFFSPFQSDTRFLKRFIYATIAALVAFSIASIYYLSLFKQFLIEAGSEAHLSNMIGNLGKLFSLPFPFIISPFMLLLIVIALFLQIKNKDKFLITILTTLILSTLYMSTTISLGVTYLLYLRIIFTVMIARGLKYASKAFRFVLAALVVLILYVPLLTSKPFTNSELVNRFFYSFDEWTNGIVYAPRDQKDIDWDIIYRFVCLFRTRYKDYDYEDIGYFLAGGLVYPPVIALALVREKDAWLKDVKMFEEVINVDLEGTDYTDQKMEVIRAKKLVIFTLPKNGVGKSYDFLREIYNIFKEERYVDFSFDKEWGLHLPGKFTVMMMIKRQQSQQ